MSIGIVLYSGMRCKSADVFIVMIVIWRNVKYSVDVRTRNKCSMRSVINCIRCIVVVYTRPFPASEMRCVARWQYRKLLCSILGLIKMVLSMFQISIWKKCNSNKQYYNPKMKIFRNFLCYSLYYISPSKISIWRQLN